MNDKNYHLALIVQDDSLVYRKVYVRKEKGRDWQMVWIETGHWMAVNANRGRIRLTRSFRQLQRSKPILAGRIIKNFREAI